MTTWIIIGATSAMGEAFARKAAGEGHAIILTTRKPEDAKLLADDLQIRGAAAVDTVKLDLGDLNSVPKFVADVEAIAGEVSVALFAGSMWSQDNVQNDPDLARRTYMDNLVGPAALLQALAPILEAQSSGTILALSSVAGDRGRASNYTYGSAKAGFSTFLSGLRNRLAPSEIRVITVKPGFVDTDMTWGLPGLFLVASPESVAERLWSATQKGSEVIYVPGFWWIIMTIIKSIPEPIFKKLKL
ncbi:MAG: SDR family oxidoreductase [Pseudomonadota bacterium]